MTHIPDPRPTVEVRAELGSLRNWPKSEPVSQTVLGKRITYLENELQRRGEDE